MTVIGSEDQVHALVGAGKITEQDASEVLDFMRFLRESATWPTQGTEPEAGVPWIRQNAEAPYVLVPVEWVPYIAGEGPAPEVAAGG